MADLSLLLFTLCSLISLLTALEYKVLDHTQEELLKSLEDYEIVIPSKVNHRGEFRSHELHRRRARSVDDPYQDDDEEDSGSTLHYKVPVAGKHLIISLEKNTKLVAPGFIIEIPGKQTRTAQSHDCHYLGKLHDNQNSNVALSNCFGLRGLIQAHDEDYFIEPLFGHEPNSTNKQHPHLVYTRRSVKNKHKDSSSNCHTQGPSMARSLERHLDEQHRSRARRRRRAVSVERFVETLLVADRRMMRFYKGHDIESYLFTIMNMVSSLYRDASIGSAINIVLVKMILLEDDLDRMKLTHHADKSMEQFCKWATQINPPSENHPNHHDLAILVTRKDICRGVNKPCGTLGLSQVNGMCTKTRSCNINEDSGLSLAFTIAHETGHNFGMLHDGNGNTCKAGKVFLMSPLLTAHGHQQIWSACSRDYMRRFLYKGWGWCLNDEPESYPFPTPKTFPGVMYDANVQCRLQYGTSARYCLAMKDVCGTLWCQVHNSCQSKLEPAADGTSCGKNKWCFKAKCVRKGKPPKRIDGGWGPWSNWTQCSRSCNMGISYMKRKCDNPRPQFGGKYCVGEWKKYRICNPQECEETKYTLREMQCTKYNYKAFKGKRYKWKPQYIQDRPCELYCVPRNYDGYFKPKRFADAVEDGTRCYPDRLDICINGKCEHVGCDFVLHSKARYDKCGVCHGDGTSCETVKNSYNKTIGEGYVETAIIPSGARNIMIEEVAAAPNYIALKSPSGQYYLNGHWYIQWSGEYEAAGTLMHYTRKHNKERLTAPGPTKDDLQIMLLFQTRNPGINYEYTIPRPNSTILMDIPRPLFMWRYSQWTPCSVSCGGGTQRSVMECVEDSGHAVDDGYCQHLKKGDDMERTCQLMKCPPVWWKGHWQDCSVSCGWGVKQRSVLCVRSIGEAEQVALNDLQCRGRKPRLTARCSHAPCFSPWITGNWSKCSQECGHGIQTRLVNCSYSNEDDCTNYTKPADTYQCYGNNCSNWVVSNWEECTSVCDLGYSHRAVECNNSVDYPWRECDESRKPSGRKICFNKKCTRWQTTPWSQCSTPCGQGEQSRSLKCMDQQNNTRPDFHCAIFAKPPTTRKCYRGKCWVWKTSEWSQCPVTCGGGLQRRTVECRHSVSETLGEVCPIRTKPSSVRECSLEDCPVVKRNALAEVKQPKNCKNNTYDKSFCQLVGIIFNYCSYSRWREKCCETCYSILT